MKLVALLVMTFALSAQIMQIPSASGNGGGSSGGYSTASVAYTTAAPYFFPPGGGLAASTTEANVQGSVTIAGTISNFSASLSAAPGANTVTFTWRKNGTSQALTCSITGSNTFCKDVTNNFQVAVDDKIAIQAVVTGGTVTASVILNWGTPGTVGPQGPQGTQGATGYSPQWILSTGAPSGGNNGDMALDSSGNVYGPKASGVWPGVGVNILGPQGIQGAQGNTGPSGAGFNGTGTYAAMIASSPNLYDAWKLTNGSASSPCTNVTGTDPMICYWNGSGWVPNPNASSGSGFGSVIRGNGDPNGNGTVCPATTTQNGAYIDQQTSNPTNFWYCVNLSGTPSIWFQIPSTLGSGPYSLSGAAGSPTLDVAANRPTCTTDALYYAVDTFVLSQCSAALPGTWTTLNTAGNIAVIFNPILSSVQSYDSAGHIWSMDGSMLALAGTGGVTANKLVSKDTSNPTKYVLPSAAGCGTGIAASTAAAGSYFWLRAGAGQLFPMVVQGSVTAGDLATGSTSAPGSIVDTGQTSRNSISASTCLVGVFQASGTDGQTISVKYDGSGTFGAQPPLRSVSITFSSATPGTTALTAGTTSPAFAWCTTINTAGTAESWDARVDTGTATFKVWRGTSTTSDPTVANSLNTSGVGVSTGTVIHSTDFSDFTGGVGPTFALRDKVCINLSAVSGSPTQANFTINYR